MNGYPIYKPIDLPWLSEIPVHWSVLRNKNIFSEVKDTVGSDSTSYTLLSLTLKGIIPRDIESGKGKFPKDFDTYKIVKTGNMAFCLFDIDETPRTVGLSAYDGMLTGAYTIFQVGNVNARYTFYYYLALDNIKALRPLYSGLRKTINVRTFLGTKFPLPPRKEQDQIVRFLDWKVSAINRLINIKRKEIRAINAMKQSVVSGAVTHGLDTTVPMKYSEVKWLGDIPAHWQTSRIKQHFALRDERNLKKLSDVNLLSVFSSVGVIPRSEVNDYSSGNKAVNADGYKIVHRGDIVVNIILCWMGALGKSNFDGVTSPAYDVYKPDETVSSKYYHYLFRAKAFTEECYKVGRGIMTMRWRVYSQQFMNINIPIPPNEEQQKIVNYLDRKCAQIDASIAQTEESITVLQELKNRLISDVVTGKIDVRDIDIPEYEFVEEDSDGEDEENPESVEGETDEE